MANDHGEAAVGATVEWYTPPSVFDALGLTFDLDPASPGAAAVPWVPAAEHFTIRENGLMQPWSGRIWLNPPYGPQAVPFLHRLVEHGNGIALVFARTETTWWQQAATRSSAVCFLRERLWFIRNDGFQGRAAMGSALMAFGAGCADAVIRSGLGWSVQTIADREDGYDHGHL